mgnify:CR=1 FL=1
MPIGISSLRHIIAAVAINLWRRSRGGALVRAVILIINVAVPDYLSGWLASSRLSFSRHC